MKALIKQLDLPISDKDKSVRLASWIVADLELQHIRRANGWEGGGSYWAFRASKPGERLTWSQYCLAMVGITEATARNYHRCAEAVKTRLRCLPSRPGAKSLLRQMERQPTTMTAAERADMIQKIIVLGLNQGDTASILLREWKGMREHKVETQSENIADSGNEGGNKYPSAFLAPIRFEADDSDYHENRERQERLLAIVISELRMRQLKRGI
jgi:hypothetical protein